MSYENREEEIIKLLDIENKRWNTHMLRVCARSLSELKRKDFKKERSFVVFLSDRSKEYKILQDMIINKAKKCNEEEWGKMYEKLVEFESKRHLHPRKKYIEYSFT